MIARAALRHVLLMASAVNAIDASGLESLEAINHRLADGGIQRHRSEGKGPVMNRLNRSHLLDELPGKAYLSQDQAFADLALDTSEAPPSLAPDDARGLI